MNLSLLKNLLTSSIFNGVQAFKGHRWQNRRATSCLRIIQLKLHQVTQ